MFLLGKNTAHSVALALVFASANLAQTTLNCQGGRCIKTVTGTFPVGARLRVNANGPVALDAGSSKDLTYTATAQFWARSEADARRMLEQYAIRMFPQGEWSVLATPMGPLTATLQIHSPKLSAASIYTMDGSVEARGVDGTLDVESGGGPVTVDRIAGDCRVRTGGGGVRAGALGGALHLSTGVGSITVASVSGEAVLQTMGGDIVVGNAGGAVYAETGVGMVRVEHAAGQVTATSGGGQIWVGDARGMVITRSAAGPVRVGSAAGVNCDTASGYVELGSVYGAMRVATAMGDILASLMGGRMADSFLSSGNGDITVMIPSNVGVTIQAENAMADSARRIVSEFPQIPVRVVGMRVVAEGAVNGGGPVLHVSASSGTIFIKRK